MANQLGKSLLNPESGWTRKYCSLANVGPGKFFYDVHHMVLILHRMENGM